MKDSEAIIKVENVSKTFKLPHEKFSTVKQHFVNVFSQKSYERFKALEAVSFEIKKGEFFGIIGANGSGKSTMLKLLAGIYQPSSGKVTVRGSLSPFIELGVGFNPELTARENIFLNAAILGLTKKDTEEKFDGIVNFSELGEFLDQKLKNFSSGMQVRLAFSIALQADADILLIDEVLAVGDSNFQQKCFDAFRDLKKKEKTIIFVSHDLPSIQEFCERVILLKKGKAKFIGFPNQTILEYQKINTQERNKSFAREINSKLKKPFIKSTEVEDFAGEKKNVFNFNESFRANLEIENAKETNLNFGVSVYRSDNTYCFGANTFLDKEGSKHGVKQVTLEFEDPGLLPGSYYLIAAIFGKNEKEVIDFNEHALDLTISGSGRAEGVSYIKHHWKLK